MRGNFTICYFPWGIHFLKFLVYGPGQNLFNVWFAIAVFVDLYSNHSKYLKKKSDMSTLNTIGWLGIIRKSAPMVHALTATTVVRATKLFVIFGGLKANKTNEISKYFKTIRFKHFFFKNKTKKIKFYYSYILRINCSKWRLNAAIDFTQKSRRT